MVSHVESSHIPTAEFLSNVHQNNECSPEVAFSLVTEFADISHHGLKQKDRLIASILVNFLTNPSFVIKVFRLYTNSLADCNDISSRRTSEVKKHEVLHRATVRAGCSTKTGFETLYE